MNGPLNIVHNDYSVASGKPRARALLAPFASDEGTLDAALDDRVSIVNVWCPLNDVTSDPLAFIDWKTLHPGDCRVRRVSYDTGRVGETTGVYDARADDHDWLYWPKMARGTAMLLKTWDSKPGDGEDATRSLYAAHASARLGGVDRAENPRQSVEMRCILLYSPIAARPDFLKEDFCAPHVARVRSGASFFEKVLEVTYVDEDPRAWTPPAAGEFAI